MDTRSKKYKWSLVCALLAALSGLALCVSTLAAGAVTPFTSDFYTSLQNPMVWTAYALAWQAEGEPAGLTPSEYYAPDAQTPEGWDEDSAANMRAYFDAQLEAVLGGYGNFSYAVLDPEGRVLLTNTSADLSSLADIGVHTTPFADNTDAAPAEMASAEIALAQEDELPSDVRFTASFSFGRNGPVLESLAGRWTTERGLSSFSDWMRFSAKYSVADIFSNLADLYGDTFSPYVPDVTVVLTVYEPPPSLDYDGIRWQIMRDGMTQFGYVVYLPIAAVAAGMAAAAAVWAKRKLALGAQMSARAFTDLPLWGLILALGLFAAMAEFLMLLCTGSFKAENFAGSLFPQPIVSFLCIAMGFAAWFAPLALVFVSALLLAHLPRKGFFRALAGRSFVAYLWRKGRAFAHRLGEFDLSQPLDKAILRIVLVNLALVSLFCLFWVFGLFGVIPYSIVLFFALRRWGEKLQRDYLAIYEGMRRMAAGEPGAHLEENAGIFDALRVEMNAVQDGIDRAVEEKVRSQNMKTELITNVSHDLKTPLTAIITYVDLLKDDSLDEATRRAYIETLDKKSQRLKRLIEDLFEMSKAASGNITFTPQTLELGSLMRQVLCELEDRTTASGVDFRAVYPPEKVYCMLDGQKTWRILENLIVNITKYAMPGTRAYLLLTQQSGRAVLTMKNVSAEELDFDAEHITDRFVRGDRNRSTDGSGLGLAIAKSFTELQGGTLAVTTDGDLFKVTLSFPLCAAPAPAQEYGDGTMQ